MVLRSLHHSTGSGATHRRSSASGSSMGRESGSKPAAPVHSLAPRGTGDERRVELCRSVDSRPCYWSTCVGHSDSRRGVRDAASTRSSRLRRRPRRSSAQPRSSSCRMPFTRRTDSQVSSSRASGPAGSRPGACGVDWNGPSRPSTSPSTSPSTPISSLCAVHSLASLPHDPDKSIWDHVDALDRVTRTLGTPPIIIAHGVGVRGEPTRPQDALSPFFLTLPPLFPPFPRSGISGIRAGARGGEVPRVLGGGRPRPPQPDPALGGRHCRSLAGLCLGRRGVRGIRGGVRGPHSGERC